MKNGLTEKMVMNLTDERFTGGNWRITVIGLDLIFKVLCLICRIMIYRLPVRDSIDRDNIDDFREELKELENG